MPSDVLDAFSQALPSHHASRFELSFADGLTQKTSISVKVMIAYQSLELPLTHFLSTAGRVIWGAASGLCALGKHASINPHGCTPITATHQPLTPTAATRGSAHSRWAILISEPASGRMGTRGPIPTDQHAAAWAATAGPAWLEQGHTRIYASVRQHAVGPDNPLPGGPVCRLPRGASIPAPAVAWPWEVIRVACRSTHSTPSGQPAAGPAWIRPATAHRTAYPQPTHIKQPAAVTETPIRSWDTAATQPAHCWPTHFWQPAATPGTATPFPFTAACWTADRGSTHFR